MRGRIAAFFATIAFALSPLTVHAQDRLESCEKSPRVVGACFTIHGRLSIYNGSALVRIWRIGTHRMLAVPDDWSDPSIPDAAAKFLQLGQPGQWTFLETTRFVR